MKKKILSIFMLLLFCFAFGCNSVFAYTDTTLQYNGGLSPRYAKNTEFPFNINYNFLGKPFASVVGNNVLMILTDYYLQSNTDYLVTGTYINNSTYINLDPSTYLNYYTFRYSNGQWVFGSSMTHTQANNLHTGSVAGTVWLNTDFFTDPTFTPTYSGRVLTGIDLSFNEDDFVQWIIDNDKVDVSVGSSGGSVSGKIPAYIGLQKLRSFIHFYKSYGGSNSSFLGYIGQWFSKMNIVAQTTENVNILKKTIDILYQEYLNSYMKTFYDNSANQVHHRRNIVTNTDDTDLTLVTDDTNDTIDISILRDILRAIIQFQTTFSDYMERLFAKLDNLDFVTTVVNDGGNTNPIDLSDLYNYDSDAFSDDLQDFETSIEEVQSVPMGYISTINQNGLMPENMLQDKNSLTVNIPTITGFTVANNGGTYSTQTGSYVLRSTDYPWLDTVVQKIKRFASIILILGYLVHLRYRIPELIRGE